MFNVVFHCWGEDHWPKAYSNEEERGEGFLIDYIFV